MRKSRDGGDVLLPHADHNAVAGSSAVRKRIRVLHIVLNLHHGGLERVVGEMVRGFDASRFEVHLLALQYLGRLADGLDAFAELHVARAASSASMLWPATLRNEIARIAPDVVHTHSGVWFKASRAARMANVPFLVHTDHGRQRPDPWQNRFFDRLASRDTDVVIAVSNPLADQLARTVVTDASRVRVVRNGVNTDDFCKCPDSGTLRAELGIGAEVPIIGSIGRLDPIKAFDVMLEAFLVLRARWTGAVPPVLVIAGDGPERPFLERVIKERRLERSAHLLGWRDNVQDLASAFTLFTMSSKSEGTSIGLLEAMSAELCPVVTAVGGNPDVLGDELRHRLCEPSNPQSLAERWYDALLDDGRRAEDALRARARVIEHFSMRRMVAEHEAIYAEGLTRTAVHLFR